MGTRKKVDVAVGEDITVPANVSRSGKLRIRSESAAQVARWFGLGQAPLAASRRGKRPGAARTEARLNLPLAPGTITLVTGASGAGKSSLLRDLRKQQAPERPWTDLNALRPANVPIVDCFDDQPLMETLKLLGRVGLGEAWSYLRTPAELSEGQRFRLRLAMGLWRAQRSCGEGDGFATPRAAIIVCDEFAAMLDRLTAMIVARCLRRAIDAHPHIAAVLATSHDDLIEALAPDVVVRCDFGRVELCSRDEGRRNPGLRSTSDAGV